MSTTTPTLSKTDTLLSSMLRPLVVRSLKRFLSHVFLRDSIKDIELQAIKGSLGMKNLIFKENVQYGPLTLLGGTVGRLEGTIPWSSSTSNAKLKLSDVELSLAFNVHESTTKDFIQKQRLVAAGLVQEAEEEWDDTWIDRVLENVSLQCERLHVRFTVNGVVLGFVVESLAVETCDEFARPAFVMRANSEQPVFRKLLMRGLSMDLREGRGRGAVVVEPTWISALVVDRSKKRRLADVKMGPVRLRLGPAHVGLLGKFLEPAPHAARGKVLARSFSSSLALTRPHVHKLKPWIVYAVSRLRNVSRANKLGWKQFLERLRDRNAFVALYIKRLNEIENPKKARMAEMDRVELNHLEAKLPFHVVMLFRAFAEAELSLAVENALAAATAPTSPDALSPAATSPGKTPPKSRLLKFSKSIRYVLSKRRKSSVSISGYACLSAVERQKLYEACMESYVVAQEEAPGLGIVGNSTSDAFGSTLIGFRCASATLTLLNHTNDVALLSVRAYLIAVDATFLSDAPQPDVEYSICRFDVVDEVAEKNILLFKTPGLFIERLRRSSLAGIRIDESVSDINLSTVKLRAQFSSKYLQEWKDGDVLEFGTGINDTSVKICGRLGGFFRISSAQYSFSDRLIESLAKNFYAPLAATTTTASSGSSNSALRKATNFIIDAPTFEIVSVNNSSESPALMSASAESLIFYGAQGGMLRKARMQFGSNMAVAEGRELDIVFDTMEDGTGARSIEIVKSLPSPPTMLTRFEIHEEDLANVLNSRLSEIFFPATAPTTEPVKQKRVSFKSAFSTEIIFCRKNAGARIALSCDNVEASVSFKANRSEVKLGGSILLRVSASPDGEFSTWFESKSPESSLVVASTISHLGFEFTSTNEDHIMRFAVYPLSFGLLFPLPLLAANPATQTKVVVPQRRMEFEFNGKSQFDLHRLDIAAIDEERRFASFVVKSGINVSYEADLSMSCQLRGPITADDLWLRKINERVHVGPCFFSNKDVHISVSPSGFVAVDAMGLVKYRHQQTFTLELFDHVILMLARYRKLMGLTGGEQSKRPLLFKANMPHGLDTTLIACALAKDATVAHDQIVLSATSFEVSCEKDGLFKAKWQRAGVFALSDREPTRFVACEQNVDIDATVQRFEFSDPETVSLGAATGLCLMGARFGENPGFKRNLFDVVVSPSSSVSSHDRIILRMTRGFARTISLLFGENVQDIRRALLTTPIPESPSGEPWTKTLEFDAQDCKSLFASSQDFLDKTHFKTRTLKIKTTAPLDVTLLVDSELDDVVASTIAVMSNGKHLEYTSWETRRLLDASKSCRFSTLLFAGKTTMQTANPADQGLSIEIYDSKQFHDDASFRLDRLSRNVDCKDEQLEVHLGQVRGSFEHYAVRMFHVVTLLRGIDFAKARSFGRPMPSFSTPRWAKLFRLRDEFSWVDESLTITCGGSLLQLRGRRDSMFSVSGEATTEILESPMKLRVDGLWSTQKKQTSIVIEHVRARATLWMLDRILQLSRRVSLAAEAQLVQYRERLIWKIASSSSGALEPSAADSVFVVALRGSQLSCLSHGKPHLRIQTTKVCARIADSKTKDLSLGLTFFNEDPTTTINPGMSVLYFNPYIVKWEPFLESVAFNFDATQARGFRSFSGTLHTTENINFNCSIAFLEVTRGLLREVKEPSATVIFSEWFFQNDCGLDVELFIDGEINTVNRMVAHGNKIPLQNMDAAVKRSAVLDFGPKYHRLHVQMTNVGYFVFPLFPKIDGIKKRRAANLVDLSLSVSNEDGSWVVLLCSSVAVVNKTSWPLQLMLMPQAGEVAEDEGNHASSNRGMAATTTILNVLQPGASLFLPVQALTTRLSLTPVGLSLSYSFWSGISLASLRPGVEEVGLCEALGNEAFAFRVYVRDTSGGPLAGASTAKREGRLNVEIHPMLILTNCLPLDVEYRLKGSTERFALKSGTKGMLHDQHCLVTLRVAGSAWSLPFDCGHVETCPKFLALEDVSEKQLKVLLEMNRDASGTLRVVVYAKAWFLNKSELDLVFRVGETRLFDRTSRKTFTTHLDGPAITNNGLLGEVKLGSACEYFFDEQWLPVVVIGIRPDDSYDVILSESNVKVGGVIKTRLRLSIDARSPVHVPPSLRSNISTSGMTTMTDDAVMYSEASGTLQAKVEGNSLWSNPFSIETVGTEAVLLLRRVELATQGTVFGQHHVLAVHVGTSPLAASMGISTKVLTFVPRFRIEKKMPHLNLVVCAENDDSRRFLISEEGERTALHVSSERIRLGVELKKDFAAKTDHSTLTGSGFRLSEPLDVGKPCDESIKLHNLRSGETVVVRVKIDWADSDSPTLVAIVSLVGRVEDDESSALYWVENRSSHVLHYSQTVIKSGSSVVVQRLLPQDERPFGWDYLNHLVCGPERMISFEIVGGIKLAVRPDDLTKKSFHLAKKGPIFARIVVKGIMKRIVIMDEVPMTSDDELDEHDDATISTPEDQNTDDEADDEPLVRAHYDTDVVHQLRVRLVSVCFSLIDAFPQELMAAHFTDFESVLFRRHRVDGNDFSAAVSTRYCQVDNCTITARLPVVLWPSSNSSSSFFMSAVTGTVTSEEIVISNFSLAVQPFDLFLEERLVLLSVRAWNDAKSVWAHYSNAKAADVVITGADGKFAVGTLAGRLMFVEKSRIEAISCTVTVQRLVDESAHNILDFPQWRGPGSSAAGSGATGADNELVSSFLPSAMTDLDHAVVSITAYEKRRVLAAWRDILGDAKRHYKQEFLTNVYRSLSLDLMRVVGPGSGLRVENAGHGLLHGAFGALDVASKMSGAIGSGAAFLSLDSDFMLARRKTLIDERPDGMGAGVMLGAKAIGTGIVLGITGIVTQPIYGAAEGGFGGFVVGLGKGIVGVGVRPVVGVFDMLSNVFAGGRSATAWLDPSDAPRRARLPHILSGEARVLETFDAKTALVQDLLVKLWGEKKWRACVQGANTVLRYKLLERETLVLARVDRVLVCVDFMEYARLLSQDKVDYATLNAARPVLAWEIDGRAVSEYRSRDPEANVVECVLSFNGDFVCTSYGRAAATVFSHQGSWLMHIPFFSPEGKAFLLEMLKEISLMGGDAVQNCVSNGAATGFGLFTSISPQGQIIVSRVQGASAKCGIRVGDEILAVFGKSLRGRSDIWFHQILSGAATVHEVELTVSTKDENEEPMVVKKIVWGE